MCVVGFFFFVIFSYNYCQLNACFTCRNLTYSPTTRLINYLNYYLNQFNLLNDAELEIIKLFY